MTAITIRLPDEAHARLKELAKQRKMSMNKLFEEMTTITLTEFDSET
jgi:predicted transcriptional regulator